jgi:hypothetical protein
MLKVAAGAAAALFVLTSPAAYAQSSSAERQGRLSVTEPGSITDLRVETVKAALQLTPDQEKYWPAIENAIRTRAKHRAARLENLVDRASDLRGSDPLEFALKRNPVDLMRRRSDALAQRSDDLKKLADAWQPLYQVLSPDQKRRMALLRLFVLREAMNRIRGSGPDSFDEDQQ